MDQYFIAMEDLSHRVLVQVNRVEYQDLQLMSHSNEKGVVSAAATMQCGCSEAPYPM